MDSWCTSLGVHHLAEFRVWTGDLGRQARSPSSYAFRWAAHRLGLRPAECCYLAGADSLRRGAIRAGWQAVNLPASSDREDAIDLEHLLLQLESLDLVGGMSGG